MKKNIFKYSILFIAPALLLSTVAIAGASWKDSTKNDSISVEKITYTIEFFDGSTQYGNPFQGLEYNSGFEMPIINSSTFEGWTVTSDGSGEVYTGFHTLNEFADNLNDTTLTMYSKYAS